MKPLHLLSAAALALVAAGMAPSIAQPVTQSRNITVLAKDFDRATSSNVALGGPNNMYGATVLLNAPPYDAVANVAFINFTVPRGGGGQYRIYAEYAAAQARPVTIKIGTKTITNAMNTATGCWLESCQKMLPEGIVTLAAGANRIRISRSSVFPHIRKFVLVPINPAPVATDNPE